MKQTWKVLGWKFTQLNSAMEDATSQLKTGDTLYGSALRTDEVKVNMSNHIVYICTSY